MGELVSITVVIFGIFQIILFFKLWGMTNNVEYLKKQVGKNELIIKAKVLALKGELGKAKEILDESFMVDIAKYRSTDGTYYDYYDKIVSEYTTIFESLQIKPLDFNKLRERSFELFA